MRTRDNPKREMTADCRAVQQMFRREDLDAETTWSSSTGRESARFRGHSVGFGPRL